MNRILKYPLNIEDVQNLSLPKGSKVLSIQVQENRLAKEFKIMLWAECDTDEVLEDRTFCIFGTGQAVKEELKHLSTVQMNGYVWHIYEKI